MKREVYRWITIYASDAGGICKKNTGNKEKRRDKMVVWSEKTPAYFR